MNRVEIITLGFEKYITTFGDGLLGVSERNDSESIAQNENLIALQTRFPESDFIKEFLAYVWVNPLVRFEFDGHFGKIVVQDQKWLDDHYREFLEEMFRWGQSDVDDPLYGQDDAEDEAEFDVEEFDDYLLDPSAVDDAEDKRLVPRLQEFDQGLKFEDQDWLEVEEPRDQYEFDLWAEVDDPRHQ